MLARKEKRLSPNQEARAHVYCLAGTIGGGYIMARRLVELESLAKALRKRFEAICSYPWANEEKYLARTDRMIARAEQLLILMCVGGEINRDPRGAAIKLFVDTPDGKREFYL